MALKTIGIEIDGKVYKRAETKAEAEQKTINRVVVEALYAYIGETPPPLPKPKEPEPPTETPGIPKTTIYVVQSGDTLGAIAKKMYGTPTKYYIIQKANNLTDPGKIWVGQKLVIPVLEEDQPTPTQPPATEPQPPTEPETPSTPPTPKPPVADDSTLKNPKPPNIKFVGSPNFNKRPTGEISAVVMHATANGSLERVIDWFNNPNAQVSAHYTIGKDGTIVQHVRDEFRAWHAGKSEWKGRKDLNSWAIGVEMVNWNNGEDPFPEPQYQAGFALV
ncbi:MAG TPA: LysM peptidoglycan-binding domain-containing protein, partial [Anaerolineae bacterium]|nr:LysM peptidoglycan-binding domain-containing protein [Anaerolineae bacterium]